MSGEKSKKIVLGLAAGIGAAAILVYLLLGPPKLLAQSESPLFCAGCHVMEDNFESWAHSGAHRRIRCIDCHLPNDNVAVHYLWKSIDGMKDVVFFYSGHVPEQIKLSAHGAKVMQKNCINCHEATVEMISHDRKCWECHRRLMHKRSGAMATT